MTQRAARPGTRLCLRQTGSQNEASTIRAGVALTPARARSPTNSVAGAADQDQQDIRWYVE